MSFLNANSSAFFTVSKSNSSYFPDSGSNDLIIGIQDNTQNILFGIESNTSILKISNSNVTIGGSLITEMIAVSGQIIGTGTNVVFSPISSGWTNINETEPTDPTIGIGIGEHLLQVQNSFVQWPNSTTMLAHENQNYTSNAGVQNVSFQYTNSTFPESNFSHASISITGKQISQDFALSKELSSTDYKNKFFLTAPNGLFSIGFETIKTKNTTNTIPPNTTINEYDESIVFRCYYNKQTVQNNSRHGYYYIKGSQFINIILPQYSQINLEYWPVDNPNNSNISIELDTTTKFRITRLSIL
jgi:hypothetical protein